MRRENMGNTENCERVNEKKSLLNKIIYDIAELNIRDAEKDVEVALEKGVDPRKIIEEGLSEGLKVVGERYEKGEYFLSELIMSAEVANTIMKKIEPKLISKSKEGVIGKVIIGTVQGDLHDIGKNLTASLLKAVGFEVYDLGVDVSPENFVEAVKKYRPNIVGMSALLTVCIPMYKKTIKALEEAGLRKKLKILIGGGAASEKVAREVGADSYAENAWDGVRKARDLIR
jgi:methylmalonyl-CoA mutase cobalamin-binding domain/chain